MWLFVCSRALLLPEDLVNIILHEMRDWLVFQCCRLFDWAMVLLANERGMQTTNMVVAWVNRELVLFVENYSLTLCNL